MVQYNVAREVERNKRAPTERFISYFDQHSFLTPHLVSVASYNVNSNATGQLYYKNINLTLPIGHT